MTYNGTSPEDVVKEAHKRWLDHTGTDDDFADLHLADLCYADLHCANMHFADLSGANLSCADLRRANLSGANLSGADLSGANLQGAENVPYIPIACPDYGSFIGWKKAKLANGAEAIIKLLIPDDAKRTSATGRKCRCDKAIVIGIWSIDVTRKLGSEYAEAISLHDSGFIYRKGEMAIPTEPFCDDRWQECSSGIHFFVNLREAINY